MSNSLVLDDINSFILEDTCVRIFMKYMAYLDENIEVKTEILKSLNINEN